MSRSEEDDGHSVGLARRAREEAVVKKAQTSLLASICHTVDEFQLCVCLCLFGGGDNTQQ